LSSVADRWRCALLALVAVAFSAAPLAAQVSAAELERWLQQVASPDLRGRELGTRGQATAVATLLREARALGLAPTTARGPVEFRVPVRRERMSVAPELKLIYRPAPTNDPKMNVRPPRPEDANLPIPVKVTPRLLRDWDVAVVPTWYIGGGRQRLSVDTAPIMAGPPLGTPVGVTVDAVKDFIVVFDAPATPRLAEFLQSDSLRRWLQPYRLAKAVAITGLEQISPSVLRTWVEPRWTLDAAPWDSAIPPVMVLSRRATFGMLAHDDQMTRFEAELSSSSPAVPVTNLVLTIPGADRRLDDEYVILSAPLDGVGTRGDTVYPGADDGGSGAVALLGIARELLARSERPARTVVFVWHAGTEHGLLGSEWFLREPPVPRGRIVAAINVDRLARGSDTLRVLGEQQLPSQLAPWLTAYAARTGVPLDWSWDAPGHPWQLSCRSDHASYTRAGIPALTINSAPDQRTRTAEDRADSVDYARYAARVSWLAGFVAEVASQPERPVARQRVRVPRDGACVQ
jgi:hypothetical protein